MNTITIPMKNIKDDLIIMPRSELARLLALSKKSGVKTVKSLPELAFEARARKNIVGPFKNTKDLFRSLGI
ncbi:hypothetical protein A2914_00065 [Candidatus Nomurabacteria bacterium RIFCSPLOWO2_01_FULL_41_21]|uniref:Uncharacterized protein n=2 Tax=Candidatus Nomuraibacteriota TaxID=1752729 RepID=A0A1F6V1S8_9BACT|nr:MAG: hypothetical protein A2733_00885 [Candidatus Nomurabacteria bacterium RIFCSPHIGHO2_01_FULL_40_20]OGI88685.1 MAG: hypothetical protein A2914_00065 [Candidatus Nomurabacteria bacterium RIFCSPLOWO2_01_FULL_41_21]